MKILVVGASSGVGLQVVKALQADGSGEHKVSAMVRDRGAAERAIGGAAGGGGSVSFVSGDVAKPDTLPAACRGMDAVVCTVGARKGWCLPTDNAASPKMVDYLGVKSLAEAAAAEQVARFVLVSSAFVTRPLHPVNIMLSALKGRVMHWKYLGEHAVRDAYGGGGGLSYAIVRPGGLQDTAGGQHRVVIGQGDKLFGAISRADVARMCLECVTGGGAAVNNVTFEVIADKSAPADASVSSQLSSLRPDPL